jgi:hypothetical protein
LLDPREIAAADVIKGVLSPLCADDRARTLASVNAMLGFAEPARRPRKPRKPTLASVAEQANKAALAVARYEVKPDGTVVIVTGKPESAEAENPWPLDEFRTKETKQ